MINKQNVMNFKLYVLKKCKNHFINNCNNIIYSFSSSFNILLFFYFGKFLTLSIFFYHAFVFLFIKLDIQIKKIDPIFFICFYLFQFILKFLI